MSRKFDASHLSGHWKGWYKYGPEYPISLQQHRDYFWMELAFKDQNFEGVCHDAITDKYFTSPAEIKGVFQNNTIHFLKTYPGRVEINESKNIYIAHDQASHDINYQGLYKKSWLSRKQHFAGEWEIIGTCIVPNGHMETFVNTGTWGMKKGK